MTDESDFPEAWRPDLGEHSLEIAGKVEGVTWSPDFGYGKYPIVTITDSDGKEWAIHAQAHILRTELRERNVGRGDDLWVKYLGKRAPKSGVGNDYHVYKVKGGKEPEFNWDAESPDGMRNENGTEPPIAPAPIPPVSEAAAMTPVTDDDVPFLWRPESWDSVKNVDAR